MKRLIVHRNIALLATISMVVLSLFMLNMARADSWSWTTGIPTKVYSDTVSPDDDWNNVCESKFQSIRDQHKIEGVEDQSRQYNTECLIGSGDNYQLFEGDDGKLAVSFGGESNAHVINSGATCFYGCVYMPSRDYLISIQSPGTFGDGKLVIFKDFVKRLRMQRITLPNLRTETYFTGEQSPDEILTDRFIADDFSTTTKHLQRSQNDKWLVFELVGRGMYRMDMDTGQTTKFLYLTTKYWDPSSAPSMQIDITNDGRFVALFGRNTSNAIYELVPDCGFTVPPDPAQIKALERQGQPTTECPALYLAAPMNDPANNTYVPNLTTAYQPKFSDDGGEISLYATGSASPVHHVSLRAANYTGPQPLDYLALGDSFSSGEGDTDTNFIGNKYYLLGTDIAGDYEHNIPFGKCHISNRSYPYLLASSGNINQDKMKSVACSGALSTDIDGWSNQEVNEVYMGQDRGGNIPRLKGIRNFEVLQESALYNFTPGQIQQIEFLKKYKPGSITLTVGGNDVQFARILDSCIRKTSVPGMPCNWATSNQDDPSSPSLENLGIMISGEYNRILNLYSQLHIASPKTKIFVIGYPQFTDSTSLFCPTNFGLNQTERLMITNGVSYMNEVIKSAAASSGAYYVDIENSIGNGVLCGSDFWNTYINGTSTAIAGISGSGQYETQEAYHPNANGHKLIFNRINAGLNGQTIVTYNQCNQIIICPDILSGSRPPIPDFFKPNTFRDKVVEAADFAQSNAQNISNHVVSLVKGIQFNIHIPTFSFSANSPLEIQIHSDPISLGLFTTEVDGSLDSTIMIPSTFTAGYHTITYSGFGYSGLPVQYMQIVLVEEPVKDVSKNTQAPITQYRQATGIEETENPRISTFTSYINNSNGSLLSANESVKKIVPRDSTKHSIYEWLLLFIPASIFVLFCMGRIARTNRRS